jgi:hypothetical protein
MRPVVILGIAAGAIFVAGLWWYRHSIMDRIDHFIPIVAEDLVRQTTLNHKSATSPEHNRECHKRCESVSCAKICSRNPASHIISDSKNSCMNICQGGIQSCKNKCDGCGSCG